MQPNEFVIDIIGFVVLTIVAVFYLIISFNLYKSWKKNGERSILYFFIGFLCAGIGFFGLITEKVMLAYVYPDPIGELIARFSAVMGIFFSIGALLGQNAFSLEMTIPEHIKKALPPIAVVGIIPTSLLILALSTRIAGISEGEFVYPDWITLVMMGMILPVMLFPCIIFFYHTIKMRKIDMARSRRSLTMGIAMLILAISYTVELAGNIALVALIFRFGFLVFAILMYASIELPNWYRKLIGWSEE